MSLTFDSLHLVIHSLALGCVSSRIVGTIPWYVSVSPHELPAFYNMSYSDVDQYHDFRFSSSQSSHAQTYHDHPTCQTGLRAQDERRTISKGGKEQEGTQRYNLYFQNPAISKIKLPFVFLTQLFITVPRALYLPLRRRRSPNAKVHMLTLC